MKPLLFVVLAAIGAVAENCGLKGDDQICPPGECCSFWNWCGISSTHCGVGCLKKYSSPDSPCSMKPTVTTYPSAVPTIDICGPPVGKKCPGAGPGGYFYRCCSSNGHCGPKNPLQPAADYCGSGCQVGYGLDCNSQKPVPPSPPPPAGTVGIGMNCGPIVNKKCAKGLCCSGSNFCGMGKEYCAQGEEGNWCQEAWGMCW
ncbi:hypothetical protein BDD12DRAFT_888773 [Trichophaea hybrida]|nr:hypothetical protein BDD12DRAFT_888773 [Trichophaea hybrida]